MTPHQRRGMRRRWHRTKTTELDAALIAWVTAERSQEVLAEASTERDAEYTGAEVLAAASAEDYLAAEKALRVSTQVATQPDVTSAEEMEATKRPRVRQQQPLHQPSSSSSSSSGSEGGGAQSWARGGMSSGVQRLVGADLDGGTQSWCRGGVGNGGWQARLGQKAVSTHPFDPGKSEGVTITLIHRERRPCTVVGAMSVKERG